MAESYIKNLPIVLERILVLSIEYLMKLHQK